MKKISLTGKTKKKTVSPKLYFLVFSTEKKYFTYWNVHHSLEEAREVSLNKMLSGKYGPPPSGEWKVETEVFLSPRKIENLFRENANEVVRLNKETKNNLIKSIIDKKDSALLKKSIKQFNKKELAYIHGRL